MGNYLFTSEKKHLVILDLNGTLLHRQILKSDSEANQLENCVNENMTAPDFFLKDIYAIYQRPGMQKLIESLLKNFEVGIWWEDHPIYAQELADDLLGERSFDIQFVLDRSHCEEDRRFYEGKKDGATFKNLNRIWSVSEFWNDTNTIIIDDNPNKVHRQLENAIIVPEFNLNIYQDTVLSQLQKYLEKLVYQNPTNIKEYLKQNPITWHK